MALNPPSQYADDTNLAARQRLWEYQAEPFDLVGWVLDLAGVTLGDHVLDVGCGNGRYLWALQEHAIDAVGCDLSFGMLRSVGPHPRLANADVTTLPLRTGGFDVVLAPHMLYHVPDRPAAAAELRRVLHPGGVCIVVTNGQDHLGPLRRLVERSAATPGWAMMAPSAHAFSLENGAAQLETAFATVRIVQPSVAPAVVTDPEVIADYVASVADHYENQVRRPWPEIVQSCRAEASEVIDRDGAFVVPSVVGAFACS